MAVIDYVIVVIYLLGMVGVGLMLQKKASQGLDSYFLGSNELPWWALGASGMASNFDVAGTMMLTGFVFTLGMNGMWLELRGALGLFYVFLMIFMGKWARRSEVMTSAEWMKFRFGDGMGGRCARVIQALSMILTTIVLIAFFCKGAGAFVAEFLNIPAFWGMPPSFWAAVMMIVLAMIYTVASGLQGVVWTDVFQGILIFIVLVVICVMAMTKYDLPDKFNVTTQVNEAKLTAYNNANPDKQLLVGDKLGKDNKYTLEENDSGKFLTWQTTKNEWSSIIPDLNMDFPGITYNSMYNMFGILIIFYIIRVLFSGFSGADGYVFQRILATKNEKEAGLMMMFWIFLYSFRWPLVMALAIMGITLTKTQGIDNPEMVLPMVITQMIPVGLKGLLIAGLVAAAMSTFDSTVNNGASFWIKDIYQAYIKPNATEKQLVFQSRTVSIIIVIASLIISLCINNLGELWSWMSVSLAGGLAVPLFLRWYWWRLNGWGFTAGVAVGMAVSILQKLVFPASTPEFYLFLTCSSFSFVAMIIGTFLTEPMDKNVLRAFYHKTKPFGIWGPVKDVLPKTERKLIKIENIKDLIAVTIALPWMFTLYLLWVNLVVKRWDQFFLLLLIVAVLSTALYFIWYKRLDSNKI
jgi:solute:Na+ symporter, SSS family